MLTILGNAVRKYQIYKTTNLINGKIYIGQLTRIDKYKKDYFGSGVKIRAAIKKYGAENFKREILLECDNQDDLNEAEIFFIKEYKSQNSKIGYNIAEGGKGRSGYKVSEKN